MRDERVAELMKQSVAGKAPREHWEQRVLSVAISHRRPPYWLVWFLVPPIVVCGFGFFMFSAHEQEKAVLFQQRQAAERAQALAERQAKELQKQIASIESEQSQLEEQLRRAKTEAQRAEIQRQMQANKSRVRALKQGSVRSFGPAVHIGAGDTTDPLSGIK